MVLVLTKWHSSAWIPCSREVVVMPVQTLWPVGAVLACPSDHSEMRRITGVTIQIMSRILLQAIGNPHVDQMQRACAAHPGVSSPVRPDMDDLKPGMFLIMKTIDNTANHLQRNPQMTIATERPTRWLPGAPLAGVQITNHLRHHPRAVKVCLAAVRPDRDSLQR